jgi:hypothetical protein
MKVRRVVQPCASFPGTESVNCSTPPRASAALVDAAYERRSLAVSNDLHPSGFDETLPKTFGTAPVDRFLRHAYVLRRGRHHCRPCWTGIGRPSRQADDEEFLGCGVIMQSLDMRRVPANELERGIAVLEDGFSATLQNEVFDREIASGTLCSLGEEWTRMNVLLTGEDFPDGIASLPVLGGAHVASFGSPVDIMVWLDVDGVRSARTYLSGLDFDECFERRRKQLVYYPDDVSYLSTELRRLLGDMQRFYALAVAAGEAVVKRVYE